MTAGCGFTEKQDGNTKNVSEAELVQHESTTSDHVMPPFYLFCFYDPVVRGHVMSESVCTETHCCLFLVTPEHL